MLPLFGGWASTSIFRISQHSPLHHNISSNSLILVALHKESALHAPSKLLYRCLATTDLLVGLVAQPLVVTYWMSVVHEHWTLCHYAVEAAYIIGSVLCGVSLLTMAAISVDRLLALLAGLRYKYNTHHN